jgi:hypothetical protein
LRVDPASDDQRDQEAAEFLSSCMNDMSYSWSDTLVEVLSMLPFGWSYHEIIYKRRLGPGNDPQKRSKYNDGRIGWRKIPIRAQETFLEWQFDDEGGLRGMVQTAPPDFMRRVIPIEKALLFRTKMAKANPEGRSIFRNANRSWYFKKNIEELEGIGIERDLAGLPVAYAPPEFMSPTALPEEKAMIDQLKRVVTNIKRDEMEGIVFPSEVDRDGKQTGYKLALLSTGSRRQFDTSNIIERYDLRIAMTVLADFLMLGHESVGSFALSSDKTDLFSLALAAILDNIRDIFNTHAVPRLFALNSFPGITALPRIEHGDIETPNLTELGDYINTLTGAGIQLFPDDNLENYLREAGNLPAKPENMLTKKLAGALETLRKGMGQKKNSNPMVAALRKKTQRGKVTRSNTYNDTQLKLFNDFNDTFTETGAGFSSYIQQYMDSPEAMIGAVDQFEFVGAGIQDKLEAGMTELFAAGWEDGKKAVEAVVRYEIDLTYPSDYASKWAAQNAADKVKLINENSKSMIRDMIRSEVEESVANGESWEDLQARLIDKLADNQAFSAARCECIARTESGTAYNTGAVQCWKDSGMVPNVEVSDGDGCAECSQVNGAVWTLEEALNRPLQHPNCVREFFALVDTKHISNGF